MRCVQMTATGGTEVLQVTEVPQPDPGPGEALVRVRAAGVNPVDTKVRQKGLFAPGAEPPAILGCDGAGAVERVGEGVDTVAPGDRVLFMNGGIGLAPGNYAEYAVVDARFLARTPDGVPDTQAAAMPLVALTAWEALLDRAGLRSGERVLVHAGAGGVGHVAIQLARAAGAHVITTVSDADKAQMARDLGAEAVIHYEEEDVLEAVRRWTDGAGVEVVLDTVGGAVCSQSLYALATYGRLVTILALPGDMDWQHARLHNLAVVQELMLTPMILGLEDARRHQAGILAECAQRMADGRLQVRVAQTYSLEQASTAHERMELGGVMGKLVLTVDE